MGLFSSKRKTIVGTTVSRAIGDDSMPNSIKTGVLTGIMRSGELTDYMLENLVSGLGMRAENMYSYAEKKYTHGLPSGEVYAATQGQEQVEVILAALEGTTVTVEYSRLGAPNSLHVSWMRLVSQYGYNPDTNELTVLSAQKGKPVFLDDMAIVVPASQFESFEPGALEQWGAPAKAGPTPLRPRVSALVGAMREHTPVVTSTTITEDVVRVSYVWEANTPRLGSGAVPYPKEVMTLPIDGVDDNADYFHVKYQVNGVTKYWMYRLGAGTHPQLDAVFNTPLTENGVFFPFAYFRYNKRSEITDKSTEDYKTSKRLVKYLGVDYDTVAAAIDENPDIGDVQQAMLIMAVPANTTNPLEQRYLFDFFEAIHSGRGGSVAPLPPASTFTWRGLTGLNRFSMVIQDKRFKMSLSDAGIFKRRMVGSIGRVGSYSSGTGSETYQVPRVDETTQQTTVQNKSIPYHYYRYQVTQHIYEEVRVLGLQMQYFVLDGYATTADETDDILLIPLDRSITTKYTMKDKEVLYARSLHYVFNSAQVIKIKWYQTGVFKALLLIIAVVMAIYDGGATLGAVLGLNAVAAIIATVIINLIIGQLLPVVFKLFVRVFGKELATLLAIIAIIYGAYQIFDAGSVAGAPWASELLQAANGLTAAVMDAKFTDLMGEYTAFNLFVDDQTKVLEDANKLLENRTMLSPFVIFGEAPDDYYNRTVHSGNIGVLGIQAVSSYTEMALTLPKLNDTLGEY